MYDSYDYYPGRWSECAQRCALWQAACLWRRPTRLVSQQFHFPVGALGMPAGGDPPLPLLRGCSITAPCVPGAPLRPWSAGAGLVNHRRCHRWRWLIQTQDDCTQLRLEVRVLPLHRRNLLPHLRNLQLRVRLLMEQSPQQQQHILLRGAAGLVGACRGRGTGYAAAAERLATVTPVACNNTMLHLLVFCRLLHMMC